MSLLEGLNPQQREAVETTDGPVLILAGAGSGKTRVITYRIAYLVDECGVPPSNLLAVTFTNKAAAEMRDRVERLIRTPLGGRPWVSTFHSFCVRLLREDGGRIGLPRQFTIYDENDQTAVVKACMRHLGLGEKEMKARAVLSRISHAKNHGMSPERFYEEATDPNAEKVAQIYRLYNKALAEANAADFDDLLLKAVHLLSSDADTALKYNQKFRYILVDEYQDTNRPQYELIRLLTQTHQNLCVVGDEDQSIYSWRGADIRNIVEFEQDFPQAKMIRLEENYRSTQVILDAASAVVSNNLYRKGKKLWTTRESGDPVYFYEAPDAENEALFTADWISKRLRGNPDDKVAILYRTNSQSRLYEESLRRYGLKYNLVGGFSFYERAEVKDMLAYLKVALNPQDSVSLLRVINSPSRGIGATTEKRLEDLALANNLPVWEALNRLLDGGFDKKDFASRIPPSLGAFRDTIRHLIDLVPTETAPQMLREIDERTGYTKSLEEEGTPEALGRIENISELFNAATDSAERGETLPEFLDHAALVSDSDGFDEEARIAMMTLHSAKGLEFPVVFFGGMEEGLLPHSRSLLDSKMLEEERRLCYVGMTRAKDTLILTRARSRRSYGDQMFSASRPSRFWDEIPPNLMADILEKLSPGKAARRPPGDPGERFYDYDDSHEPTSRDNVVSIDNVRRFFGTRGAGPLSSSATHTASTELREPGSARVLPLGTKVKHSKYGYGTVIRREGSGEDAKVLVSFPGFGLKKLVEKFAGLERA